MSLDAEFQAHPTGFTPGGAPINQWGGAESQVMVRFYRDNRLMRAESERDGKPVYKATDMVEVRIAGEKDTVREIVDERHKRRWPRAWDAYERGQQAVAEGTPLAVLFPANPEVVTALNTQNVWTIEALARLPDSVTGIPFLTEHKKKAAAFLEASQTAATLTQMNAQLSQRDELIAQLSERLAALEKADPPKPKPKE